MKRATCGGPHRPATTPARAATPACASDARGPEARAFALQHAVGNRAARERLEASASPLVLRRACAACEANDELQRAPDGHAASGGGLAPPIVHAVLRSHGTSLPAHVGDELAPLLGARVGDVRIHADAHADASARAVNALAYTVGRDIVFRSGQYAPETPSGMRLLRHELAHVRQQGATSYSGGAIRIGALDDHAEHEAERASDQATATTEPAASRGAAPVLRRAPAPAPEPELVTQPAASGRSLAVRLTAFKELVKHAGRLRMAANVSALADWRQFLQNQLSPEQVKTQVRIEEVGRFIDFAGRQGSRELAVADEWLHTRGENRRWVQEKQVEGQFHACSGCHLTVQANALDQQRAAQGVRSSSPLELLDLVNGERAPRPAFAPADELSDHGSTGFAHVAQAEAKLAALRPYLRALGPDGFQVLPPETLTSNATGSALLADLLQRIGRRQADYLTFRSKIDEDFDYLELRPIVRELLPIASADVRAEVEKEIKRAEKWSFYKAVAGCIAAIGLLLLTIFPPTSALGIGLTLALGAAVSAHAVYQGYQSFEQGRLYALARGANNVLDPAQQEAAESLMAMGLLNMVLGSVGVASSAIGVVRFVRARPPSGGGLGTLQTVEAKAGGELVEVQWGKPDPHVVIRNRSGEIIRQGPASSFRPSAPSARASSGGAGGASNSPAYRTSGNAALKVQPATVPEPAPAPVPAPRPAPAPTAKPSPPPKLRGVIATTAAAGASDTLAAAGGTSREPDMPLDLSSADQTLWRTCHQQHKVYKATQGAAAAYAEKMAVISELLMQNRATVQDRIDYCALIDERLELTKQLHRERMHYVALDCDKFDWFRRGTTKAQREADHRGELANVNANLRNLYILRNRFCP